MHRYRPWLKSLLSPLACLIILGLVVYYVEPPVSLIQAYWWQLLVFFTPLFFFFLTALNIYFKFIWHSLIFTIALIFAIILYLLSSLNFMIGALLVIATLLIYRSVSQRRKQPQIPVRIPKLSRLEKQH